MAQIDCIIPGGNIKILSRVIAAFSKIGDDVYLEAKSDSLCLKSVNMTTTAYCMITLYDIFFTTYEINPSGNDKTVLCKVPMKGILGVFKSHGHKDKKPEYCKVELGQDSSKIFFKFRYKHDVTVIRSLYLSEGHTVHIVYDRDKSTNIIGGSSQIFAQVLSNFQMIDEDLSIEVNPHKALIRNYIAGDSRLTKAIRSQITLMAGEFASYKISDEASATFSLKPFRAAVHFAELHSLNLLLSFGKSGRPALLEMKNPTFDVCFIMATLKADDATQSSLVSSVAVPVPELNVNWDDFDEPMDSESTDVISRSPEPVQSKKIKSIFGRCYNATFCREAVDLGGLLAPDSDPDSN